MTFQDLPDNDTTASKQEHWGMSQGSKIPKATSWLSSGYRSALQMQRTPGFHPSQGTKIPHAAPQTINKKISRKW